MLGAFVMGFLDKVLFRESKEDAKARLSEYTLSVGSWVSLTPPDIVQRQGEDPNKKIRVYPIIEHTHPNIWDCPHYVRLRDDGYPAPQFRDIDSLSGLERMTPEAVDRKYGIHRKIDLKTTVAQAKEMRSEASNQPVTQPVQNNHNRGEVSRSVNNDNDLSAGIFVGAAIAMSASGNAQDNDQGARGSGYDNEPHNDGGSFDCDG